MLFDPDNKIIKLCVEGMDQEGLGNGEEAYRLFLEAWKDASDDLEKFLAAHYVARHQRSFIDKLQWDKIALNFAMKIDDENVRASYPSLYLNIAKGYEELHDNENALKNYQLGLSFTGFLMDDSYGRMIKSGIMAGIEREIGTQNPHDL